MIDQFTKQQFEQALFSIHPGYESRGLISGEECYIIPINENSRIQIRSSIGKNGIAKSSGSDSIRIWLELYKPTDGHKYDWQSTGKKVDRLTKRIPGWEKRIESKIRILFERGSTVRKAIEPCPKCGNAPWAAFSNSAKNPGRPYASCKPCDYFTWLDTAPLRRGSKVTLFTPPKEETTPQVLSFDDQIEESPSLDWIPEQKAIFDWVANGEGHGVVRGVAGCGKTSSNVEAMNHVDEYAETVFLAFNKHIAQELQSRGVNGQTLNSLGNDIVLPLGEFDQWKVYNIVDSLYPNSEHKPTLVKINSLLKANLLDPTPENLMTLFDVVDFDIDQTNQLAEMSANILREDWESKTYDYNDQIYWPLKGRGVFPKFDFIAVDEAQDLNYSQICFVERCLDNNGRILLIGDPNQAVYKFRGAYVGIMDMMTDKLQATVLPLPVSFRAPLSIVERVNTRFPEIDFRAYDNATDGEILTINEYELVNQVQDGDAVICRYNAPLIGPCFSLIRRGIKAVILGRDIGKSLNSLIEKRSRLQRVTSITDLIKDLYIYLSLEKPKLEAANKWQRLATLTDQVETIIAISDGCQSISQLKFKIEKTFSQEREGITFSTIHKFKGLESKRVFLIDKPPHPKADQQQSRNLDYVGDTRTLDKLYLAY